MLGESCSAARQRLVQLFQAHEASKPFYWQDFALLLKGVGVSEVQIPSVAKSMGVEEGAEINPEQLISWLYGSGVAEVDPAVVPDDRDAAAEVEPVQQIPDVTAEAFSQLALAAAAVVGESANSRLGQCLDSTLQSEMLGAVSKTRVVLHPDVSPTLQDFLIRRKRDGSFLEQHLYREMDVVSLISRLLSSPPMSSGSSKEKAQPASLPDVVHKNYSEVVDRLTSTEQALAQLLGASVPAVFDGLPPMRRKGVCVAQVLGTVHNDAEALQAHCRLVAETLLLEADARASEDGAQAYVLLAEPGDWQGVDNAIGHCFVDAVSDAVFRLRLPSTSDLHFSPALAASCGSKADGEVIDAAGNSITVHICDYLEHESVGAVPQNRLLVAQCALPASRMWTGCLDMSASASKLSALQASGLELLHPAINTSIAGKNLCTFTPGTIAVVQGADLVSFSAAGPCVPVFGMEEQPSHKAELNQENVFMRQHLPEAAPMVLTLC
mmetsp:Transcript_5846/g.12807  ORF Transcript_5846/g.12807 Transcript_5846/m.12807 type:complete len:495 (+) Transcript_5846:102-1586(+)